MNSKKKWSVIVLIILVAILPVLLWGSSNLFQGNKSYGTNDIEISKTSSAVKKLYSTRPFVMAENMDKAISYAAKLGIEKEAFDFVDTSVLDINASGTWVGMKSTDNIGKMVHLLLPNSVKTIDATKNEATKGIKSVHWLSITADTGSQLSSITAPSDMATSAFNTAAWLERLDLSQAKNLTSIPSYTFYSCDRLYDVALPDSIKTIGSRAITSSALHHISLPSGLGNDGSGLDIQAFAGSRKIVDIELPANATSAFESKVKSLESVSTTYLNVYKKGSGRSWIANTNTGFVFCKNTERNSVLASGSNIATTLYEIGKWYLVGYRGPESGGDTVNASNDYMVKLPEQIDLSRGGADRKDAFDYIDCSGIEIQNDFSDLTTSAQLGSNVALNSPVAGSDVEGTRIIAGVSGSTKLRYSIGTYAFYYRWVWHTTVPDNTVDVIGNSAFDSAPIWTFNLGDVNTIGAKGIAFLGRTTGLVFYFPSNNPFCADDALDYKSANSAPRLIIYRNHTDYNSRTTVTSGLHKSISGLSGGSGKFYSYLIDIVPNVSELDVASVTYNNTEITEAKLQRLYSGGLENYSGGGIYADGFRYLRDEADVWRHDATSELPALTEYTGYTQTSWYTDTNFTTQYSATSIGTENASNISSLRNAYSKGLDSINIYAKKINNFVLSNKERSYTDPAVHENSTVITGIPASVISDYAISVVKYVDSNRNEKTYTGEIQEAGEYTLEVRPNSKYGSWNEAGIPTMTVIVNKATVDLSDSSIFRMGVTSDGSTVLNLRPGKEIASEQQTSLYYYSEQGSWYTSEQVGIGELTRQKDGLWNSFVRAQNTSFRLALITPIIKDVHTNEDIFTCDFPTDMHDKSGEYVTEFTVSLTERELNNYQFVAFNDEERQLTCYVNTNTGVATITKFWYIVQLNNWLTSQGYSGSESPSYNMAKEWEFGTDTNTLFKQPTVALGLDDLLKPEITFSLFLNSPNLPSDTTFSILGRPISEYDSIINESLPIGNYRIEYSVNFPVGAKYDTFKQSYLFAITDKDFTAEEKEAVSALKNKVFEYDMKTALTDYAKNRALFDLSKIDSVNAERIKDMLGITNKNTKSSLRIVRNGIWASSDYDNLFDDNFSITYNLNRMWNNTYNSLSKLIDEHPMNQPDVYTVYYQMTAKNRKSLVNESNDIERRQYNFTVVVYKTLTVPTIKDSVYDGSSIFPTISYSNSDLNSEETYYKISLPVQDNVNTGDKHAILTIDDAYYQLYRWAAEDDTPSDRKFTKQIDVEYKIIPSENSTMEGLYIAGWSWNSQIDKDDILWSTKFGNDKDNFTFTLVPIGGEDSHIYTIDEFGTAPAGNYILRAYCPADDVNGNWKEFTAEYRVAISVAVNTWYKSPSISTWNWKQFEDFDWDAPDAVSPIDISAIPTYYSNSDVQAKGSGRFDFRIYSINQGATGNDRYNMVYFDDEGKEFHFQYAKDANGDFIKKDGNFVVPIYVAKRLADLPAGQYYLVATVYNSQNYTGLNNTEESFVYGAVQFSIGSSNNLWSDTIAVTDWTYMGFELGRNIHTGLTKWETQLEYALYLTTGDSMAKSAVSILGVSLSKITDFNATVKANDGKYYTYAQLINMLEVGQYTLTVHGDAAPLNDRGGINYRALDDLRRVTVNKARNTLTSNFTVNTYTIGGKVEMNKYTARFEEEKVGYRISRGGFYVDGLSDNDIQAEPITYDKSMTYEQLLEKIKELTSAEGGRQYTLWYTTNEGANYEACSEGLAITVYLGQNNWDGDAPKMKDWTYDKSAHAFDKSGIKLIHKVDDSKITLNYYTAIFDEDDAQYVLGMQLTDCPVNTGIYFVKITVESDEYYKGLSVDLLFRIDMADNGFSTDPSIKGNSWEYSQLAIGDIITGVPSNEEENMYIQYVVSREVGENGVEEHIATMTWILGRSVDNNLIALDVFYSRLNALDVGEYKLNVTLSSSANYKEKILAPINLKVNQAKNGFEDGKEPTIVNNVTKWEWNEYDTTLWKEVATKFGNVLIFIDDNAIATLSVANSLSRLEVGEHKIRFVVNATKNYEGFDETRIFNVIKNKNGWKDGDKDATAFVKDWTWGKYNNDIIGGLQVWKEPAPNYGVPQATIYKGKDGVGGSEISRNIGLYSLDIVLNGLDAGQYYIIWEIAGDGNYESITREFINFEVKVNPNEWDPESPATMHENDKKDSSGIEYGWTWGEYGKDADVDYFTAPKAKYGLVVANITKYDYTWSNPVVIVDGISNNISISNTLERLDVGRYKIVWSVMDPNKTGNFKEINYPNEIEFIVNRGVNAWTGDKPYIEGWQWGAFDSSLWKAPGLVSGRPNATVIVLNSDGTDGEHIIEKISAEYLSAQLAELEVGNYRLVWTADENDNYEIEGENEDDLKFSVTVNNNGWLINPAITAKDSQWQWKTFTLAYWQNPSAQYHHNNINATVYKLNEGCDFEYDALNQKYILNKDNCTAVNGITLASLDRINDLSVGKYLIRVSVPEDEHGRFLGLESILPFEIVPNENEFISDYCYVKGYTYADFRGYWSAPDAQFGEFTVSIYKITDGRELIATSHISNLNDILSDLHVGKYEIDWTISADVNGNYLGGKTKTSAFEVSKAFNRWLVKPHIDNWAWGSFDVNSIEIKATPAVKSQENLPVYFKIVDNDYNEIDAFSGIVDSQGYFTDIKIAAEAIKSLKPATYHLLAYYPELDDYYQLDSDNDCAFVVKHAENKWDMTPDIVDWAYGSPTNLPSGSAIYGEEIKYTYYKAVLDEKGEPIFKNGKYQVVENSAFYGWNKDEIADAGVYIVQADVDGNDYYAPLSTQFVLRVSDSKYNYWKVQPIIQSWVFGSNKSLPEGEAAYGNINWSYYKAAWNDALNKYVPTGESLSTDGANPPEEVGQYILVASVGASGEYNALIANVFFEIYERTGSLSSDVLVYIDIALAVLASIFTIVVISAVIRRYRKNDGVN